MPQKLNSKNNFTFKEWQKIKKFKKKELITFYKKFIKNYLSLNKKYCFNKELSKKYIFNQIKEVDIKKNYALKLLPVGIKDNINTKFLSTDYGLRSKKKFNVGNNANIVDKIINNGGLIFSKTNCAEYAVHHISDKLNVNPHNNKFIAGTSSTGSAIAVSCGALPVAIGTQTAGSIIRPASFCGVYGFKPTFGSIDRTGILKNNDLFDTVGIISSEIRFIESVFKNVLNDSKDFPWNKKYQLNLNKFKKKKKLKIGYFNDSLQILNNSTPNIKEFYQKILKHFKANLKLNPITGDLFNKFHAYHEILYNKSLSYYLKNYIKNKSSLSKILKEIVIKGEKISVKEYDSTLIKTMSLKKKIKKITSELDFIVVPSTFSQAPKIKHKEINDTSLIWTAMGYPCINIPFKYSKNSLPFGMLIISNEFNDFNLLEFCKKIKIKGMIKNAVK